MKRIFSYLLIAAISIWSILAYADVTIKRDGQNVGRVEEINIKTGATCTGVTCIGGAGRGQVGRIGESAYIDETNFTGVNWAALNDLGLTVNWNNAQITNNGINWTDIQAQQLSQGTTSGINWADLNPVAGGINWTQVVKSGPDNALLCIKAGQIGRCTASFSSSGAGSCTCM